MRVGIIGGGQLARMLALAGLPWAHQFVFLDPAADACAAGLGFGRFLEYQVRDLVQQGRLEIVLAAFEPPPQPVSLLTTDARLVSHRLRLFRAALREALAPGSQR